MAKALRLSIHKALRTSIAGGLTGGFAPDIVLVVKNLITQSSDQLITQSGDTFTGNVR